jgi:hypothetical protein
MNISKGIRGADEKKAKIPNLSWQEYKIPFANH